MVRALSFAVGLAVLSFAAPAAGQQATERHIPIGRSPGLSGEHTWIGTVADASPAAGAFVVAAPGGPRRVRVSEATRIWLDRSQQGLPTVAGNAADCREGQTVEVHFEAPDADWADWIKVGPPAAAP